MNSENSGTNLNRLKVVDSRSDLIKNYVKGRSVLHIGCADSGMYESRKEHGGFLHDILMDMAERVYGIDIDKNGLERMKKDGYKNIYYFDIINSSDQKALTDKLKKKGGVDVIYAGEVIEHVPDPVKFLSAILLLKNEFNASCILTTPNPFYFGNFFRALRGREIVHPDHNFYFTIATLRTVLKKSGFSGDAEFVAYLNLSNSAPRRIMKKTLVKLSPLFSDGLIAIF